MGHHGPLPRLHPSKGRARDVCSYGPRDSGRRPGAWESRRRLRDRRWEVLSCVCSPTGPSIAGDAPAAAVRPSSTGVPRPGRPAAPFAQGPRQAALGPQTFRMGSWSASRNLARGVVDLAPRSTRCGRFRSTVRGRSARPWPGTPAAFVQAFSDRATRDRRNSRGARARSARAGGRARAACATSHRADATS